MKLKCYCGLEFEDVKLLLDHVFREHSLGDNIEFLKNHK